MSDAPLPLSFAPALPCAYCDQAAGQGLIYPMGGGAWQVLPLCELHQAESLERAASGAADAGPTDAEKSAEAATWCPWCWNLKHPRQRPPANASAALCARCREEIEERIARLQARTQQAGASDRAGDRAPARSTDESQQAQEGRP